MATARVPKGRLEEEEEVVVVEERGLKASLRV
jgi:hypothetical protein